MKSPCGLQFDYVCGCMMVSASGRGMIENKAAAIMEIAEAVNGKGVKATLVDLRDIVGSHTFVDRCQLGELAARHLANIPIAALGYEKPANPQPAAANPGPELEVFTNSDAAQLWIRAHTR